MTLRGFIARRAARAAALLLLLSFSVFLLSRAMPGDPWTELQADPSVSAETLNRLRADYGLDRPPLQQYAMWLGQVLQGRFGYSPVERLPVAPLLGQRLLRTLTLASLTLLLACASALAAGAPLILGYRGRWLDYGLIPFLVALPAVLSSLFINWLRLGWFPPRYTASATWGALLLEVWWPALALAIPLSAFLTKQVRRELRSVLAQPFVAAARAKGLGTPALLRAVLKPAAPVILNLASLVLAALMGGAVVAETVFDVPGIGMLTWNALLGRDTFLATAALLAVCALVIVVNLAADVAGAALDPRERRSV